MGVSFVTEDAEGAEILGEFAGIYEAIGDLPNPLLSKNLRALRILCG